MRRISSLSVLCFAAAIMSACSLPDEVITTEDIPTAGVRFINAVPDTNLVDMRFYDLVESNAHFRIGFRANPVTTGGVPASTQVQYKGARAGSRKFRVFLDDTSQAVATTMLLDTTFTFEAGKNYTVMMWGNARSAGADKMRFDIWEEAVADPTTQVALRMINATNQVVDGYQYLSTGAVGAASWTGLAARTAGTYVTVPVTSGTATRKFQVRNSGGANPITNCPDPSALTGAVATADLEGIPGTHVAGSAITAIVFPGSVAGSKGVQFGITTGSVNQRSTAAGYESARSYINDGFCPGMTVTPAGFTSTANVVIQSIVDGPTTGNLPTTAAPSNIITAVPGGYVRTAGDFTANGFAVGQQVTAAGFTTAANNGVSIINAVTPLTMSVTKTAPPVLEGGTTGSISMSVAAGTLGATGGTYVRSAGSFIADGFVVGHALNATGFAAAAGATPSNNGASTITAISPDGLTMTVSKATGMANEAAAAGRTLITTAARSLVGFGRMDVVGGIAAPQAAANNRSLTVTPLPPGLTFVWDRRPPRTACSPLC
jgi:hypothetical protein